MANRRQVLAGVATASTIAVAGCSSVALTGDDPEDVAEQYFTAGKDGDVETANEVLHPEAEAYPHEAADFEDEDEFTIESVAEASTREIVEWQIEAFGGSVDEASEEEIEQEIDTLEEDAEETIDEIGADAFAFVMVTIDQDGEEEVPLQMVQDDGDWYVLT